MVFRNLAFGIQCSNHGDGDSRFVAFIAERTSRVDSGARVPGNIKRSIEGNGARAEGLRAEYLERPFIFQQGSGPRWRRRGSDAPALIGLGQTTKGVYRRARRERLRTVVPDQHDPIHLRREKVCITFWITIQLQKIDQCVEVFQSVKLPGSAGGMVAFM